MSVFEMREKVLHISLQAIICKGIQYVGFSGPDIYSYTSIIKSWTYENVNLYSVASDPAVTG